MNDKDAADEWIEEIIEAERRAGRPIGEFTDLEFCLHFGGESPKGKVYGKSMFEDFSK